MSDLSRFKVLAACLSVGMLFFGASIWLLSNGHLHEDAYILFQYSRNLAEGRGITFDRVSGPTEGATDFLWMVALAGLNKIGLDLAVAAAALNAIGLAVLTYVIIWLRKSIDLATATLVGALFFSGGVGAAFGGFSTLAYAGVYGLLCVSVIKRSLVWAAVLGTTLALFRPDGVILAAGAFIAFAFYNKAHVGWAKLLLAAGAACVVGAIYFYWRYQYFDMLLPLPLLVKQKTDHLFEGLKDNINALVPYLILLVPAIWARKRVEHRVWVTLLLGPALLFAALSFAHQSQNIGNRFQFPIIVAMLLMFAAIPAVAHGAIARAMLVLPPLIGVYFGGIHVKDNISYLKNNDYINSFPQILRQSNFGVDNIAVTEAGRFPYWCDGKRMTDLVGLNSRAVVVHGAAKVLDEQSPDLVFIHHAFRFDVGNLPKGQDYVIGSPSDVRLLPYRGSNPVMMAPEAALAYAVKHDYRAVYVRHGPRDTQYSHVYFISRSTDFDAFEQSLRRSFRTKIGYFESTRAPTSKSHQSQPVGKQSAEIPTKIDTDAPPNKI